MTTAKYLGIWMDHSCAHVMELTTNSIESVTIESNLISSEKEEYPGMCEKQFHHKRQQRLSDYYIQLGDTIKNYAAVILFGPTSAKAELFNLLRSDQLFANIKFDIKQTNEMPAHMEHAFVREHFFRR